MSYACYDVTQLDGQEVNIFIIISSVGMFLSINHVVKTCRCSFMIQSSVQSVYLFAALTSVHRCTAQQSQAAVIH
jgi:hypothetical protein